MNRIQLLKIITFLWFFLFFVACSEEQVGSDVSEGISIDKKAQLEISTILGLPKNVEITYINVIKESDQLTKSIMFMTDEGFIDWIASYQLDLDNFDNEKRYLLGQNSGEWNPVSLQTLATAQVNFENGMVLNIGYANKEKEHVVVYLVYHGK